MSKRLCIALLPLVFICLCSKAQKGSIKGVLKDSVSRQNLSLASVTVFIAKDTSIINYGLSNPAGLFQLNGIPQNILCRIVITFQGYRVYRKEFMLTKEQPDIDFGEVYMIDDPKAMDEILIVAERPPISMHNDTLEFTANAFKTLPSAMIEDLLKKLPGVDVDLDGNITVNGKKVNRLLVDGKEFFGGDHRIATRNLPANIVDKVQVVIDKEEAQRNPLLPKDEVGQVVNIKLKGDIKQGWFGKVNAGVGTNNRHEAGGIVNLFRDTVQVSFLGYSNNVNKPGFTSSDLNDVGGFDRGGRSSFIDDRGRPGITQSAGGGTNFNTVYGKHITINLVYFYGQIKSTFNQVSFSQRFLKDTVLSNPSVSAWDNVSRQHRVGGSLVWAIDSLTSLHFSPGVNFSQDHSTNSYNSSTTDNFNGPVNSNNNQSSSHNENDGYNHSLNFNRSSDKKEGRSFNFSSTLSTDNRDNNNYNEGLYTFYHNGIGSDSLVNQLRARGYNYIRSDLSLNYTEPLSASIILLLSHSANYEKQTDDLGLYNRDTATGKYELYNEALSTRVQRKGWHNTLSATTSYRYKNLTLSPGVSFFLSDSRSSFAKYPNVLLHYFYVYPSLTANWKGWNLGYQAHISEPQAVNLQPVIDISSPLYKLYGNPALKPSYHRTINLSYFHYSQKNSSSFNFSINSSFINNATIFETLLDSNRVRISRPINVNGNKTFSGNANYNRQYKFTNEFRLALRPGVTGSYDKTVLSINGNTSNAGYVRASFIFGVLLNYKDKIELNQQYNLMMNSSSYDNTAYRNIDIVTHNSQSEIVVRWPEHFVWETQMNYTYNPQVGQGIHKATLRWNGSINWAFLKEDKAQIKLSAYDLLNQNVNVFRYTSESTISDIQTNTLHRYFLLSVVYNIRNFSGSKKHDDDEE